MTVETGWSHSRSLSVIWDLKFNSHLPNKQIMASLCKLHLKKQKALSEKRISLEIFKEHLSKSNINGRLPKCFGRSDFVIPVLGLNDITPHKSKTCRLTCVVIFCDFSFNQTPLLIFKPYSKSLARHIPCFQNKILLLCCPHIPHSCLHRCVSTRAPGSKEILL